MPKTKKYNIAFLRMEKHLTQTKLAEMIGVSKQYLCQIEKGKIAPSVKIAKKLAEVFNVNWYELL